MQPSQLARRFANAFRCVIMTSECGCVSLSSFSESAATDTEMFLPLSRLVKVKEVSCSLVAFIAGLPAVKVSAQPAKLRSGLMLFSPSPKIIRSISPKMTSHFKNVHISHIIMLW